MIQPKRGRETLFIFKYKGKDITIHQEPISNSSQASPNLPHKVTVKWSSPPLSELSYISSLSSSITVSAGFIGRSLLRLVHYQAIAAPPYFCSSTQIVLGTVHFAHQPQPSIVFAIVKAPFALFLLQRCITFLFQVMKTGKNMSRMTTLW